MKVKDEERYLVFAGIDYEEHGGWDDLLGGPTDLEDCRRRGEAWMRAHGLGFHAERRDTEIEARKLAITSDGQLMVRTVDGTAMSYWDAVKKDATVVWPGHAAYVTCDGWCQIVDLASMRICAELAPNIRTCRTIEQVPLAWVPPKRA